MSQKVSPNPIPNLAADWANDVSTGLPYSGLAVQTFVRNMLSELVSKTQFYYYTEAAWKILTNNDTDYSRVPNGTIFIYDDGVVPPTPGETAKFDSSTGLLTLQTDAEYDILTGTLTLGAYATYDASTGLLKI